MAEKTNNPEDAIVLNYCNSLLRKRDVDLLRGPHWLNDTIIGFYFEYLDQEQIELTDGDTDIFFIGPELTQLLKLTNEAEWCDLIGPPNDKKPRFILLPLNNCDSRDAAGGSHWSLLVIDVQERTSFHLDSCRGTNKSAAVLLTTKMINYYPGSREKTYIEMICPQQENGYDCGLFTLCFTDAIRRHIAKDDAIGSCDLGEVGSAVQTKREDLLRLIDELKET